MLFSDRNSRSATSALDRPSVRSPSTSISRAVSRDGLARLTERGPRGNGRPRKWRSLSIACRTAGAPIGLSSPRSTPDTAQVSLHAESGHLPVGSRASLVDAVLDLPEVQNSTHLEATVPLGDAESLQRLSERTDHMTTRAAGASALIDAELPDDP